jgi:hypothetical protein
MYNVEMCRVTLQEIQHMNIPNYIYQASVGVVEKSVR